MPWAAVGRVLPVGWVRWSFPSIQHKWGFCWSPALGSWAARGSSMKGYKDENLCVKTWRQDAKKTRTRLTAVMPSKRTRRRGHELKCGMFLMNIGKPFLEWGRWGTGRALLESPALETFQSHLGMILGCLWPDLSKDVRPHGLQRSSLSHTVWYCVKQGSSSLSSGYCYSQRLCQSHCKEGNKLFCTVWREQKCLNFVKAALC